MSERLRKQCEAFNEYEALDALPQDATPVELEENGYPVVIYGERFCRMRKDDGVICGAKVQTIPLLHKHFSDVHGVDSNLKPATKTGNPKREVLEAAVTFYEKLMGKPPTARSTSQKRKADSSSSEPPKKRATKKQKEANAAPGLLAQLPVSGSSATAFANAPVPPIATAFAPPPSTHTKAPNANQGSTIRLPGSEDRRPADEPDPMYPAHFSASAPNPSGPESIAHVAGQMLPPPRPKTTSILVPPGPASIAPSPKVHAPVHQGTNDSALPAMLPTGSQPPSLATPALDPPPVVGQTTTPAPIAPETPEASLPQDWYTKQYFDSYNMGWDDCEREYKDQKTKFEAEKEAFAREKARFQTERARFAGEVRHMLAIVENQRA